MSTATVCLEKEYSLGKSCNNSGIDNRGSVNSAGRSSKHNYNLNLRVSIEACWHYWRDSEDWMKRPRLLGQIDGGKEWTTLD
jgi:hypothetical protein